VKSSWPVAHRDYVVLTVWDELPNGTFLICSLSVDNEEYPVQRPLVRGNILCNGIWLRPTTNGNCLVKIISQVDLCGSMSAKIINKMGHNTMLKVLLNLEKAVERPVQEMSDEVLSADEALKRLIEKRSKELQEWIDSTPLDRSEYSEDFGDAKCPNRISSRCVRRVLFSTPEKTEFSSNMENDDCSLLHETNLREDILSTGAAVSITGSKGPVVLVELSPHYGSLVFLLAVVMSLGIVYGLGYWSDLAQIFENVSLAAINGLQVWNRTENETGTCS
jgi:hypothetical protein